MNYQKVKKVEKAWGEEFWLECGDKYVFKKIIVKHGHRMSWHYHEIKDETWYVVSGKGIVKIEETTGEIKPGDVIHIPPKTKHTVIATEDIEILEASTTELCDSIRIEAGGKLDDSCRDWNQS